MVEEEETEEADPKVGAKIQGIDYDLDADVSYTTAELNNMELPFNHASLTGV